MTSAAPIRLVLADDHPVYRSGLVDAIAQRPEFALVAACAGGREAHDAILAHRPDAALLDVRMPDLDGIAILEAIRAAGATTRVLFLSAYEDGALVHRALSAGASGYLSKDTDRDEICDALLTVLGGELVVSPALPGALLGHLRRENERRERFAPREREVMRLTAQGLSGPEIADALGIGAATVKTYLQRVYGKLGVSDRAAMVAEAMRRGLVA
jgi:two-component system, NarL family, nitrate/nitrite response regulator NarL